MNKILTDGIPLTHCYKEVLESDTFRDMEEFSESFLFDNKTVLGKYMKRWVGDPLHQWSRQWEYPFVYNKVQRIVQSRPTIKILDAGSGVTFFPYFLNAQLDGASISCCDYDPMLSSIYKQINASQLKNVDFFNSDLRDLPYENDSFHMVYCISVLEHTDDYEAIIEEFYRVLQPGGVLVVTFDISLDGTRDIDLEKSATLLTLLAKRFEKDREISLNLNSQVSAPDVFTTLAAKDLNPDLLPWKAPSFLYRTKSFIKTGRFGSWPPPMTIFCVGLTKRST